MKVARNIEFFHIYTDETIGVSQEATLEKLQQMMPELDSYSTCILVDNYNPTVHSLVPEDVFAYVAEKGIEVDFWAYEADMVNAARMLLDKITSPKIRKEYEKYVESRGKFPCSLLTASWYLTRLGYLNGKENIRCLNGMEFTPAEYITNILSQSYSDVEKRCFEVIRNSEFVGCADRITDIFVPVDSQNKTTL